MDSGSSKENVEKIGNGQKVANNGQLGKRRKQATYRTFHTFNNRHDFLSWWTRTEQQYNWRSNSRHPHSKGMVEYYYCKRMRDLSCPALLRVIVEAKSGAVSLANADDRQHNHDCVEMSKSLLNVEPYQVQSARVINISATTSHQ
ncbi:hypothetical protein Mgra_00003190 [Meloidogyne graminicola]|uniref:Uncharacterized protein n=1 Tax=Meloidogyne graminicola TaxID=189291 RepID=A0A8S9ZWE3_9BILA|nr:hypothetical protein Mgra_00003190 [Meloidogyne graminicola]